MAVKLGTKVRDKVTGLEGVVIGKTLWLNGCTRVGVQPPLDKDGKMVEPAWIDEPQLEYVGEHVPEGARDTGGPLDSTPRRQPDPTR